MSPTLSIAALFLFIAIVLVCAVRRMAKLAVKRMETSEEEERAAFEARINNRLNRP